MALLKNCLNLTSPEKKNERLMPHLEVSLSCNKIPDTKWHKYSILKWRGFALGQ